MFGAQAVALELGLGFGGITKVSVREENSTGSFSFESLQSKDEEAKFLDSLFKFCCILSVAPLPHPLAKFSSILHEVIPMGFIFWHQLFV